MIRGTGWSDPFAASGPRATPPHPGSVQLVDGRNGAVLAVKRAEDLPEASRYAPNAAGELVPVVKIVAQPHGDKRLLREYGPGDELLRSTLQRRA